MAKRTAWDDVKDFARSGTGQLMIATVFVILIGVVAVNYILEGQASFNIPAASLAGLPGQNTEAYTEFVNGRLIRFEPERIGDEIVWKAEDIAIAQASVGKITQIGQGSWLLERFGQNVAGDPLGAPITLGAYRVTIQDITNTPNPYYNVVGGKNTLASGRPLCPVSIKVEGPGGTSTGIFSLGDSKKIGDLTFEHQWITLRTVPATSTFPGAYEVIEGIWYARACKGTGYYQGLYGIRVSGPGEAGTESGALQDVNTIYSSGANYVTVTAQAVGNTFLQSGGEWKIYLDGTKVLTIPYDGSKTINERVYGIVPGTGMHTIIVQITNKDKEVIDQMSENFDTGGDSPAPKICTPKTYSCGADGHIYRCNNEGTSLDRYQTCSAGTECDKRVDGTIACVSKTPLGCAWENPSCASGYDCIDNKCVSQVPPKEGEIDIVCGNLVCEDTETSDNCAVDCPAYQNEYIEEVYQAQQEEFGFVGDAVVTPTDFDDVGTGFAVAQPPADNTLLLIGGGVVVIVLIGGGYYYTRRTPKRGKRRRK